MRKQARSDAARATNNEVRHLAGFFNPGFRFYVAGRLPGPQSAGDAPVDCPRYAKEAISFFSCSIYP